MLSIKVENIQNDIICRLLEGNRVDLQAEAIATFKLLADIPESKMLSERDCYALNFVLIDKDLMEPFLKNDFVTLCFAERALKQAFEAEAREAITEEIINRGH
jgi:hypothetical protein